jgi:flagellar export protein FliJ
MAQAFKFRLETVRRLRQRELEVRRREVAEALRDVIALQRRLADLAETAKANVLQIRTSQGASASLDVPQLRVHYLHHSLLSRQMIETQLQLGEKEMELSRRRELLQQANSRAKAMDKLHDRQKARFDEGRRKAEQKIEDELALRLTTTKRQDAGFSR